MNDVRDLLEQARRQAPPSSAELDRIRDLGEQEHLRRRVGATILGLAVTIALITGGLHTLRSRSGTSRSRVGDGATFGAPSLNLSLHRGEYYYFRVVPYPRVIEDPPYSTYHNFYQESWWALDGSGRIRWRPDGDGLVFGPGEFVGDAGDLSYLSLDPDVLELQLRDRVQPGGASPEPYTDWVESNPPLPDQEGPITLGLVRSIYELLVDPNASPELKAALFRVAAGLQGMSVDVTSVDPAGRKGVLLSIQTEGIAREWWFDRQSQQLMTIRDTYLHPSVNAPDDTVVYVVEAAGVTTSLEDVPALNREFIPATDQAVGPDTVTVSPSS